MNQLEESKKYSEYIYNFNKSFQDAIDRASVENDDEAPPNYFMFVIIGLICFIVGVLV